MKGDVYGEPIVKQYGNAIVRVFHPILTPEEKERRMQGIKEETVRALLAIERRRMAAQKAATSE